MYLNEMIQRLLLKEQCEVIKILVFSIEEKRQECVTAKGGYIPYRNSFI